MGFKPGVVFFSSMQDLPMATNGVTQARFGFGASDGTTEGSSAMHDADNVTPTSTGAIDKTNKAFIKMNNSTLTVDAEANVKSLDPDGFTLQFTTNDGVATQICYLALGAP